MYIQLDNIILKLMTVQLSNGNLKQDVNFNEPMLFNEESDTWSMPTFNIRGLRYICKYLCPKRSTKVQYDLCLLSEKHEPVKC